MENYEAPGRGIRPLLSLARRGRLGLLVAMAVFVLGLPMVWIKGQSQYSAEAVFQVWPAFQKTQSVDKDMELQSNSQYREFVNHLSRSVVRYDVLDAALNQLQEEGAKVCLPSDTQRKCIERLQRILLILPVPDTYMVRISLSSDHKKDLDKTVNAILDNFIRITQDEQLYGADDRLKQLNEKKQALLAEMAEFEKQRSVLAGKLGLTTFGESTVNPYDTVLALAREKLALAATERSQAKAMLEAYLSQRETPVATGRSVLELRQMDNGLQVLRQEVAKHSEELTRTMSGLEPKHPVYQAALAEQKSLQQRLQTMETSVEKSAQQNIHARLTASAMQTQQVERDQKQRVQELEAQATAYAITFREAMRLTDEIRKRTQELDDVRNRSGYITGERAAIGFVRVITRALPAVTPQGIGRVRLALILLVVCVALVLVVPIALDMLDGRVLTVGDAERAMGIEAAAWLVKEEDESTRSLAREQRRRLGSTLLRNVKRGHSRVFGFTPANIGGEVTAVIQELAYTLEQLGSRVLVVNAHTQRSHTLALNEGPGLLDVLSGKAQPMDVVQSRPYEDRALNVVSIGASQSESIQRLDLLRQALAEWSQHFDMVLVDIPPLMLNSDAELLIDEVGQIFFVVEVGAVSRGDVAMARNQLRKLDPAAIGLIVSHLPVDTAGATVKRQMVESITRTRFNQVMSTSYWQLQLELLKLRLVQLWRWRR